MMAAKVRSRLLMTTGNRPRISLAAGMAEDDVDDCWVIAVNEQIISFFRGLAELVFCSALAAKSGAEAYA